MGIVEALFERARVRYGLPEGIRPTGTWEAIVRDGRIAGVLGSAWPAPGVIEVTGLYVYPTRAAAPAVRATIQRIVDLYRSGRIKGVVFTVAHTNTKMQRLVERIGKPYGMGKPRALLYATSEV